MPSPEEIKKIATERAKDINAGKIPEWTKLGRDETMVYVGAFQEGYEAALDAAKKKKD